MTIPRVMRTTGPSYSPPSQPSWAEQIRRFIWVALNAVYLQSRPPVEWARPHFRSRSRCHRQMLSTEWKYIIPAMAQQARGVDPMLVYCWASVADGGPTLKQHWFNVSFLLGRPRKPNVVLMVGHRLQCLNLQGLCSVLFQQIRYIELMHV